MSITELRPSPAIELHAMPESRTHLGDPFQTAQNPLVERPIEDVGRSEVAEFPSPYFTDLVRDYQKRKALGIGSFVEQGSTKILEIESEFDPYNASAFVKHHDNDEELGFFVRVDAPGTEFGETIVVERVSNTGIWRQNGFRYALEDPSPVEWGDDILLSGTVTEPHPEIPGRIGKYSPGLVLWSRSSEHSDGQLVGLGPEGTKGLRLSVKKADVEGGNKITIYTRSRTHDPDTDEISCSLFRGTAVVSDLTELAAHIAAIHGNPAAKVEDGLPEEETKVWFGVNKVFELDNGNTGVLAHLATLDSDRNRVYVTTVLEYNSDRRLLEGYPKIIAMAEDFEEHPVEPKEEGFKKVVYIGDLTFGTNDQSDFVSWMLSGGFRDAAAVVCALSENPFTANPIRTQHQLSIANVATLRRYDLPVSSRAEKMAA